MRTSSSPDSDAITWNAQQSLADSWVLDDTRDLAAASRAEESGRDSPVQQLMHVVLGKPQVFTHSLNPFRKRAKPSLALLCSDTPEPEEGDQPDNAQAAMSPFATQWGKRRFLMTMPSKVNVTVIQCNCIRVAPILSRIY
jgi:hypothetical protein